MTIDFEYAVCTAAVGGSTSAAASCLRDRFHIVPLPDETAPLSTQPEKDDPATKSEFERLGEEPQLPLWKEFWLFVVENKAWWMVPILLAVGLIGVLAVLGSTGAAPFIYPLF